MKVVNVLCLKGYKAIVISTIVDPSEQNTLHAGYKAIVISTIVDTEHHLRAAIEGYKAIVISTIVDLIPNTLYIDTAIKP